MPFISLTTSISLYVVLSSACADESGDLPAGVAAATTALHGSHVMGTAAGCLFNVDTRGIAVVVCPT